MLNKNQVSRRGFLKSSGTLTAASLLKIAGPALAAITQVACSAREEASPFVLLAADEAADFAAIAARIMPTTDTPGATEAGVIYFIDRALGAEAGFMLEPLRVGLVDLNTRVANSHPEHTRFADIDDASQDSVLTTIENDNFFNGMWILTITGFFSMSKHGGNKKNVAWDLIEFEGDHDAWQSPFGYYDAEYAKEQSNGG